MRSVRAVLVPPPASQPFDRAIIHPDLWLWDSWVACRDGFIDLYCLALARRTAESPIAPHDRNLFPFHVRRFRSIDGGASWLDCGAVIAPADFGDGFFARNIWSGSALDLSDGRRLHALTGVRERGPGRSFLQTLFLAIAPNPEGAPQPLSEALLCPERDHDRLRAAGYYFGPREALGDDDGEEGGPILAWRDPFLLFGRNEKLEILWSAKVGPKVPALGRATLGAEADGFPATLHPPILLPDAASMTQAEVPKVHALPDGRLILMISACDRLYEGQPDAEVSKSLRFYQARDLSGPWRPLLVDEIAAPALDFVFGASFLSVTPEDQAVLTAPLTEQAPPELRLTFGAPVRLSLAGEDGSTS